MEWRGTGDLVRPLFGVRVQRKGTRDLRVQMSHHPLLLDRPLQCLNPLRAVTGSHRDAKLFEKKKKKKTN